MALLLQGESGAPADEGDILVTHLHRRLQPLIRYRVGDRGRRINSRCTCGLNLPVIELDGRADELEVRIGDLRLSADQVACATRALPGIGERFQMRVSSQSKTDHLCITFEGEGVSVEAIHAALLKGQPALTGLEQRGALDIRVVKRGAIPTTAGKTPRIVDERLG